MSAGRTTRAAQPIPVSINLPDSPVRLRTAYQLYARLARPTLDWIGVAGAAHAFGLADRWLPPMDEPRAMLAFAFVTALYGIRSFEKAKGVA